MNNEAGHTAAAAANRNGLKLLLMRVISGPIRR